MLPVDPRGFLPACQHREGAERRSLKALAIAGPPSRASAEEDNATTPKGWLSDDLGSLAVFRIVLVAKYPNAKGGSVVQRPTRTLWFFFLSQRSLKSGLEVVILSCGLCEERDEGW